MHPNVFVMKDWDGLLKFERKALNKQQYLQHCNSTMSEKFYNVTFRFSVSDATQAVYR